MRVNFVRFKASDGLELQGWLTNQSSNIAVIHIHGMSGNGYENCFLDSLRELYTKHTLSFFTFDNRGRGVISDFRIGNGWKHAGSCFEIFEESAYDIQGAIDYLQSLGKTEFILQGHSLGCAKVVYYLATKKPTEVIKAILLAPTDMVRWAKTDIRHKEYLLKAKELIAKGKGDELVSSQCWLDKTPISAQTYSTICQAESSADIYREKSLGKIALPVLIVYGNKDIGITIIDGSIGTWVTRVEKCKNQNTLIKIIDDAEHNFRGFEDELAKTIQPFLTENI